jgi:hypothetical protein
VQARLASLAGVALGAVALLLVTFSTDDLGDYGYQVAPAMNALLDGHVGQFFSMQPVYGGFAVLARLPFAALASGANGGQQLVYQLGALPCVLALAGVSWFAVTEMRRRGRPPLTRFLVGGLLVFNPVTVAAIQRGHPEELLTAALVIGAALAALRGRSGWAAVALGLAIATKQWALLAVLPVLIACGPGRRLRTVLVAGCLAAALTAPMAIADSDRFVTNNRMAQGGWAHASRLSIWWPLGTEQRVGSGDTAFELRRVSKRWSKFARPAVVALAVFLSAAFWLRRRRLQPEDTLGLLALVLLLRCLLDPMNNDYYHVPFLLCLAAWEGLRVRGLPVITLLATAGLWATIRSPWLSPEALGESFYMVNNVFYLALMVPIAVWVAWVLLGRRAGPPPSAQVANDHPGLRARVPGWA